MVCLRLETAFNLDFLFKANGTYIIEGILYIKYSSPIIIGTMYNI